MEGLRNLSDTVVARATFVNSQLEDGWTKLEIETNPNATDGVQAEAAGMAEGALTWQAPQHALCFTADVPSISCERNEE